MSSTSPYTSRTLNGSGGGDSEVTRQPNVTSFKELFDRKFGSKLFTDGEESKDDDVEWAPHLRRNVEEVLYSDEGLTEADISLMKKVLRTKLIASTSNVEVVRNDPKSPLFSIKSFEELRLPANLLKGLYAMGFSAPSKIQETALPILLATPPQNMIAQSQSGTGKTAAFLLAALYRVDASLNHPQVLILSPTYELALQTGQVAKSMAKYLPAMKFEFAIRGRELNRTERVDAHVVFGTPGKVLDWGVKYKFFDIEKIKVFILDEADIMIDTQGHRGQSMRIQKFLSPTTQILLFSATYNDQVMEFADMIVPNPIVIRLKREEESLDNINQYYVETGSSDNAKYKALANLFGTISMGQAFIFVATKKAASDLSNRLTKDGHQVALISGELTVEERAEVFQKFKDGNQRVLIATNVMARGIDVEQVTIVVNYDLPINHETSDVDYETYLHRIGRTGRFGKQGLAINFVDGPRTLQMIIKLENHFARKIYRLDATDLDELDKICQD